MALIVKQLTVPADTQNPEKNLKEALASHLDVDGSAIQSIEILKKSLDARKKKRIVFHYRLEAVLTNESKLLKKHSSKLEEVKEAKPGYDPFVGESPQSIRFNEKPIIIGSGPAGIFAALALVEAGHSAIIVERGEPVEKRFKTVGKLRRGGEFAAESNYCFGEGGAGTFSDGKLTCGRNHPLIRYLFEQWVRFGAPAEILYDAHPHIGTDYLLVIAKKMRSYLEERGCEFIFNTSFTGFERSAKGVYTVELNGAKALSTEHLIVAIGHSARDTYRMLFDRGLAMEPKPFAIGARFEHPQSTIDKIQFGSCELLPPAEYKLAARVGKRGIWTFCMCPGGQLLPTSAGEGQLAINGMSYHARNSGFANAAVVVNINREDFFRGHVLDGIDFQRDIEKKAYQAGGGGYVSPAQNLQDFIKGRVSKKQLKSTYKPGVAPARIDKLLPDFVVSALQSALFDYDKRMRGYLSSEGIVAGVETKTSSPVVFPRTKELESQSHAGFYPTGEGAGFAGGIVSAALDGLKVGGAVLKSAARKHAASL